MGFFAEFICTLSLYFSLLFLLFGVMYSFGWIEFCFVSLMICGTAQLLETLRNGNVIGYGRLLSKR